MPPDGRIEKRTAVKVPMQIVLAEGAFLVETATTINISRRGARVLASRRWRPGERVSLASMSGDFQLQGRVIYCYQLKEGQFCVGLEFGASIKNWKDAPWADVA
jgi:hypothetical protein